jgi:hypothetical protein
MLPITGIGPELFLLPPTHDARLNTIATAIDPMIAAQSASLFTFAKRGFFLKTMSTPILNVRTLGNPQPPENGSRLPFMAASVSALTVRVVVPLPPETVDGFNEQVVAPSDDETLHDRVTLVFNPCTGDMVRGSVELPPPCTDKEEFAAEIVKSGLLTVTVTGTV